MRHFAIPPIVVVIVVGMMGLPNDLAAGTVTIDKAKMVDKTNGGEVSSGMADARFGIDFVSAARSTAYNPTLTYTWTFGDNSTAVGQNVSHTYGAANGGNYTVSLTVTDNEGGTATMGGLSVAAISGVEVTQIGDKANPTNNGRLCFDSNRNVAGRVLPPGVNGSDKIDWHLLLNGDRDLTNTASSSFVLPANEWPQYNFHWGNKTLYASIDGVLTPGQDGEMVLTGTVSYVSDNKAIKVFFDEVGTQNPSGAQPNWFYYWKQTSAYYGTMLYDNRVVANFAGSGVTEYGTSSWLCYIQPGGHLSGAGGAWGNASGIDFFANTCRHEEQHRTDMVLMWGNSDRVASQDLDGDYMKDSMEATLLAGHPYDPTDPATYIDSYGYATPTAYLRDVEDFCLRRQPPWTNGSANSEDWASPGKQW